MASVSSSKCRQGTILVPTFVIWFVILSTIRRDLSYLGIMDWMISGLRWLSSASTRLILDFTYGSSQGKGTGERTLMTKLLAQFNQKNLLFLLDAGLYSFATIFSIRTKECDFLLRAC
ncbi:hypothetical protein [Dolichospermum sp. UHCC 0259]|uniref:hypothetical protein n=1 Tax=Dolichospermum sp. UHCC 0259 TaxID=2590010 RepID=UPI0014464ED8|nr:hypothetical protein [Dolichospermum sp. UHCC 0259]MTJ50491.1 hypothetical protein [Dolichospermum sp. UHCC 0259]